jgi:ferrochelatase
MRYEEPSIEKALTNFKNKNIKKINVVSLYPHNAMATTVTTELETLAVADRIANDFELIFVKPFYNNESYINAVSNTIKPHLESDSYDKIVFSYHGSLGGKLKKLMKLGSIVFQQLVVVKSKMKVQKTVTGHIQELRQV